MRFLLSTLMLRPPKKGYPAIRSCSCSRNPLRNRETIPAARSAQTARRSASREPSGRCAGARSEGRVHSDDARPVTWNCGLADVLRHLDDVLIRNWSFDFSGSRSACMP